MATLHDCVSAMSAGDQYDICQHCLKTAAKQLSGDAPANYFGMSVMDDLDSGDPETVATAGRILALVTDYLERNDKVA